MGQVRALGVAAVLGLLDGMLLDQDPLVATIPQGLDELVGQIRVVGQGHLGGGEAAHPLQGLPAKDGGEVVLPGADMQAEVLGWG